MDAENVDISTIMLGRKMPIPVFVTSPALGKLGHPKGEVILTMASRQHNVIHTIPTLASYSFNEIVYSPKEDQAQMAAAIYNQEQGLY